MRLWPRRAWHPRIRQRQWLHRQRLYGYRGGPPEPDDTLTEDEFEAEQEARTHNPEPDDPG